MFTFFIFYVNVCAFAAQANLVRYKCPYYYYYYYNCSLAYISGHWVELTTL